MRRQVITAAKIAVCSLGLVVMFGCSHGQQAQTPTANTGAVADQQLQKVQANSDLSDQQKAQITTMLKSAPVAPPPH